ncbi:hypothetical protein Nepgr_014566 [Nepenthes gracilis]|uniref:Uncharacterized protein n=1 Tax=Nepenthes gracilis TaxID=150966 RepID=A0AAD3SJG9_NEPGR|nr:hypothetical protein Nepgr_014566 [Nepenthes gracilis]
MTSKLPPKPMPRRANACNRHPSPPVTGLCAPCLRERLSLLNHSSCSETSSSNGIANPSIAVAVANGGNDLSSSSALPELRRCKTFSGNKCDSIGFSCEPRRRSCEVRVRNTLSALFNLDDEGKGLDSKFLVESKNLGIVRGTYPVLELNAEEEDEIRVSNDGILSNANVEICERNLEELEESKTIKEYIDLEFRINKHTRRDLKEIAGSFCIAASVLSRKLQKWRRKHKSRKHGVGGIGEDGGSLEEMRLEGLRGRRQRDSQSETGEYVFQRSSCDSHPRRSIDLGRASIDGGRISIDMLGRRSCDTDSRFSIDLGRASVDGGGTSVSEAARCSCDPPRASWDGYFTRRSIVRGTTPMVSVIENAMATVYGFDNRAFIEDKLCTVNADEANSCGSQRQRRKSFDCASSKRDTVVKADDEATATSNAKVSPTTVGIFQGTKLLIKERKVKHSRLSSLKDDSSESFESASKDFSSLASSTKNGNGFKKCRQLSKLWSIWGLLHRPKPDKSGDPETLIGDKGTECVLADSSEIIASVVEGEVRPNTRWKLVRSYSTNTARRPVQGSSRRTETEGAGNKKGEELFQERNRSAGYSPNNLDNGLLRFHLTPLKSYTKSKIGKSRLKKSHSIARTTLSLY